MSTLAARAVFEDATSVEAVAELFPEGAACALLPPAASSLSLCVCALTLSCRTHQPLFAGFHANLGKLLCQVVAQNAPAWRREAASGANTISLPKLVRV